MEIFEWIKSHKILVAFIILLLILYVFLPIVAVIGIVIVGIFLGRKKTSEEEIPIVNEKEKLEDRLEEIYKKMVDLEDIEVRELLKLTNKEKKIHERLVEISPEEVSIEPGVDINESMDNMEKEMKNMIIKDVELDKNPKSVENFKKIGELKFRNLILQKKAKALIELLVQTVEEEPIIEKEIEELDIKERKILGDALVKEIDKLSIRSKELNDRGRNMTDKEDKELDKINKRRGEIYIKLEEINESFVKT